MTSVKDFKNKKVYFCFDDKKIKVYKNHPLNIEMIESAFPPKTFSWPLLNEIKSSLDKKQYIVALTMALLLPDICSSKNEKYKNKDDISRYSEWYDEYVNKYMIGSLMTNGKFDCFNGFLCYTLRCQLVHGSNGSDALEKAINSVVHTGVKSPGCENSTTHFPL